MRLHSAPPPFVRTEATAGSMLGATAAALCALLVPPIVRYGARPLAMPERLTAEKSGLPVP